MTNNPYTREYFEEGQGSNYQGYGDDPGWGITANVLQGWTVPTPTLLEVGSAKGYFLRAARRAGFDVIGLDMSHWAVSQTCSEVRAVNLLLDIVLDSLPFAGEIYDVVCSWEVLEHIHADVQGMVLRKMLRALVPGGLFVHRIALTEVGMVDHDATHVFMKSREDWERIFSNLGLLPVYGMEGLFRAAFQGRDWGDRFFCWQKPPIIG